jgi:hypothetical protein
MRHFLTKFLIAGVLAFAASAGAESKQLVAGAKVDFTRDISPILSDNCFLCHGPDESTRKGKVRFDTKEGIFANRKGLFPVVPGKPDESEIIRRVFSTDPDEQMPPPDHPRHPTEKQKEQLKAWIAQGAKYGRGRSMRNTGLLQNRFRRNFRWLKIKSGRAMESIISFWRAWKRNR